MGDNGEDLKTPRQGARMQPIDQTQPDASEVLAARIARVRQMEEAYNQAAAALRGLQERLDDFEAAQPAVAQLSAYYGSADWFADREADEAGELPSHLRRGVLGEDLAYNLLEDWNDLAVRMQELAARTQGT